MFEFIKTVSKRSMIFIKIWFNVSKMFFDSSEEFSACLGDVWQNLNDYLSV